MKLKTATLLTLILFSIGAFAAGKSAFINPRILLEKSPQAMAALETMKSEFQDRENKLRELANEVIEMEKTYKNDSAIMSDDQKKKIEEEIVQKKRKFNFDQQSMKEDVQQRRNELLNEVRKQISNVIQEYGTKNKYDFIFSDGIAYASESVDITAEILEELKKNK
ncbi:MAG: OmpH family outer membrane protein [Gammaproteobacteria bacterium]|nr:OmpH family outer membrane protein [Gammaproteobacteria bacterium]